MSASSSSANTSALREGVQRLEITTRVTLGVLALASGVYTYLGVRDLLNGNATIVFFAAVIYAVAVSIGIYAFWTFLIRFLPHVTEPKSRGLLFGCMALGSLMIIAMSAWLNASALAGAAAIQQHLAVSVQAYTRDLDRAHSQALAAQSLVTDIQMAATRFSRLAEAERGGSLTGTSGSGTVVQLLTQMSTQLDNLAKEVTASGERAKAFYEQGGKHLTKMRELVSSRSPINERSDGFGAEAMSLMGVIAAMQQTSVAPAVKRAADGLTSGFIAPAAGGRGDLAERQSSVVGKVESAVAAQSAALSAAADKIVQEKRIEPERFQPLSTAEAVIRYAGDFLPSWAGAISIDLMPAVLVLIFCVVQANIRKEGEPEAGAATMSAADILMALRLAREVETASAATRLQPAASHVVPMPDENVTALATARAKKD
ncbi:MAG: hypothetical protein ABW198_04915 [Pseudorhodoplanes sp.]